MRKITWAEIENYCDRLVQEIEQCGLNFTGIFGIKRGGYVPAVILSHKLKLPLLDFDELPWNQQEGEYLLVVDDINDSGETLEYEIEENLDYVPRIRTVVMHSRINDKHEANFVGETLDHNGWIIYPWESVEDASHDMIDYLQERHGSV